MRHQEDNQLSLPHQDDCNPRMEISNVQQNIEQLQTPIMTVQDNLKYPHAATKTKFAPP